MDDILHAKCVPGKRNFNLIIDTASLHSQLEKDVNIVRDGFHNRINIFDSLLAPYTLNPEYAEHLFTARTFNDLLLPSEVGLSIPGIKREHGRLDPTGQMIRYPMPPLSHALVLPKLEDVQGFDKLLLEQQQGSGDPVLLTPTQFLDRLKSSIQLIQKVLDVRMKYIQENRHKEDYIAKVRKLETVGYYAEDDRDIQMFEDIMRTMRESGIEEGEGEDDDIIEEFLDVVTGNE